jgi:hypothetical protein
MAKARILTQAFIDSIKPTDKREAYADLKQPGLRLIVQPSNARSWALRYRNIAGKSAKLTIGPCPALDLARARRKAAKARASLGDDIDPAQSKRATKLAAREAAGSTLDLVENVVSAYVERYAKRQTRPRSWKETERLLKREVVGA